MYKNRIFYRIPCFLSFQYHSCGGESGSLQYPGIHDSYSSYPVEYRFSWKLYGDRSFKRPDLHLEGRKKLCETESARRTGSYFQGFQMEALWERFFPDLVFPDLKDGKVIKPESFTLSGFFMFWRKGIPAWMKNFLLRRNIFDSLIAKAYIFLLKKIRFVYINVLKKKL